MRPSKRVNALIESAYGDSITIAKATPKSAVLDLIARLRPMQTPLGLVRLGPSGDGGYLLPCDLDGIEACVSPGVSTESGFDLAIAERGINVHMADASVDGPSISHPRFHFTKKFLGPVTGGDTITIADFCATLPAFSSNADLLLQMDIEGAEYPVILTMDRGLLSRFRIIILEVHDLENLRHAFSFELIKSAFDRLLDTHTVVHAHPNNCCGSVSWQGIEIPRVIELTLLRNDRATFSREVSAIYPHPLDADNKPANEPLDLPPAWR